MSCCAAPTPWSMKKAFMRRKNGDRGMMFLAKRLVLGFVLIGTASAALLLGDRARTVPGDPGRKRWNVHIIEYVNVVDTEEVEHGILEGLQQSGLIEGADYDRKIGNAQGDMATLNALVQAALADRADLIVTLSTTT